jgi:hypothetical protein
VDDRLQPGGFLGHEPAAGIDERARADAAGLLALCGAQRLPVGGGGLPHWLTTKMRERGAPWASMASAVMSLDRKVA